MSGEFGHFDRSSASFLAIKVILYLTAANLMGKRGSEGRRSRYHSSKISQLVLLLVSLTLQQAQNHAIGTNWPVYYRFSMIRGYMEVRSFLLAQQLTISETPHFSYRGK
jgi:hypothetical protein